MQEEQEGKTETIMAPPPAPVPPRNEDWKKVGFGWTRNNSQVKQSSSSRVSLLIPYQTIVFDDFHAEFPHQSFYTLFLEQFPKFPIEFSQFQSIFQQLLLHYFTEEKPQYSLHYEDFLQNHGKSNQRPLRWDIMFIPSNTSFNLHAHPNIEIIWVISGTMHEYRLEKIASTTPPTATRDFAQEFLQERDDKLSSSIKGPNLKNIQDLQFLHNSVSAIPSEELASSISLERLRSAFIVNEIGSIHLSYTREEAAVLLVVWSGSHANVPKDEYPNEPKRHFPDVISE